MADLRPYFFMMKPNNGHRGYITRLMLPKDLTGAQIQEIVDGLEELSNGGATNTPTNPKSFCFSVTEQVYSTKPSQDVIQSQTLAAEPKGFAGLCYGDTTGLPPNTTFATPFKIDGIDPAFTTPSGYTATTDPQNITEQFLKKYHKVRRLDGGAIVGKNTVSVTFANSYKLN